MKGRSLRSEKYYRPQKDKFFYPSNRRSPFQKSTQSTDNHLNSIVPSRTNKNETITQHLEGKRLADALYFAVEMSMLVPVMIDTGATISIIPKKFCQTTTPTDKISVKGATGNSMELAWTTELSLDIGFDDATTHKFYVTNVEQDHITLGLDYMVPRGLYAIPHRSLLIEEKTGRSVQLITCADNNFSTDYIWDKFLSVSPSSQKSSSYPTISTIELSTSTNEAAEAKCKAILHSRPRLCLETQYRTRPKHSFELDLEVTDTGPLLQKPRPCNATKQRIIDENFKTLLQKGAVVRGSSPYVSPVTIVTKKDGSPRVCIDYVKLNARTVTIHYPIPLMQSLPEKLSSSHRWFSVLDLKEAYYSLPLSKRASKYAAITTRSGVYLPLRTTFGLKNAPARFCELVAEMIRGLENFVFSYLDDFLVFSKTLEEHYQHLDALLQRLDDYGMYVNEKKCSFAKQSVYFLGHVISSEGLQPLADKVAAISNLNHPTNLTELRRFLGSLNYYRPFLPGIAETLAPLNKFLGGEKKPKRTKLKWESEHQQAFDNAIKKLKNATNLAFEEQHLPLVLSTDASDTHAGAVLEQASSDNPDNLRPLAFFSKAFPQKVVIRSTFHRELTAMFFAVKHFQHRVRGRELIIRTDHEPLVKAINNGWGDHSNKERNRIEYIKEFSATIKHIPGDENAVADFLSRPSQVISETAIEHLDTPSTPTAPVNSIINQETPCLLTPTLIAIKQLEEPSTLAHAAECIQNPNSRLQMQERTVSEDKNLRIYGVTSEGSTNFRPILPKTLRVLAFHNYHDLAHQGPQKSIDLLASKYYWPELHSDVASWTKACPKCQSCKVTRHNRQALQNYPNNPGRLKVIHTDLVGPLQSSDDFRYILTIRDRGTGFLVSAAIPDKTASSVVQAFTNHFIAKFGVPQTIISDNGKEFIAHAFEDLCEKLGIVHKTTTAYNPKCQGAIERIHRSLKTAFRALDDPSLWSNHLPYVTLALNNSLCDTNTFTAHQMTFGQAADLPGTVLPLDDNGNKSPSMVDTLAFFECMRHHEKKARPLADNSPFIEKDLFTCKSVWIRNNAAKSSLEPRYTGPYLVIDRSDKYFTVLTDNGSVAVCIDRLKTAYDLPESHSNDQFWALSHDSEEELDDVALPTDRPVRCRHPPTSLQDYELY